MSKSLIQSIYIIYRIVLIACVSNDNDSITEEIKFPLIYCINNPCDARILGGYPADKEKFNFIVAVTAGTMLRCGGSLIKPNWAITAAHCGYGPNCESQKRMVGSLHVRPGTHDLIRPSNEKKRTNLIKEEYTENFGPRCIDFFCAIPTVNESEIIKVKKVFLHNHLYMKHVGKSDLVSRDIALFWLVKSVENAKLPQFPSKEDFKITECTTAGWGSTNARQASTKLLQMDVKIFRGQKCRARYERTLPNGDEELKKNMSLHVLCVEELVKNDKTVQKASLPGDSGSPLLCGGKLRGITSLMIKITKKNNPDKKRFLNIYVEFDCYVPWINKVLRQNGEAELNADDHSYLCNSMKNIHLFKKNIFIVLLLLLRVFCT